MALNAVTGHKGDNIGSPVHNCLVASKLFTVCGKMFERNEGN